jgi:molybdenum cofactor guanylyltransferase
VTALAAVLAGGRGRRMGGDSKPGAELGGRPLIAWPVAAALAAGLETVIVAKRSTPLPAAGVPVWHEPDDPTHPLAGVVAALERAGRPVVAIPCDMPLLTPELLPAGDPQVVASINTPADLATAATLLGAGHEGAAPTEAPP